MYAWYFPKGFWIDIPVRRHDWKNVIVWIDNPAVEAPKILGISTYHGSDYGKIAPVSDAGTVDGSTPKFFVRVPPFLSDTYIISTTTAGDFQDLIMWDQLTDAARAALNTTDFGKAKVPFIDENFSEKLEDAWPF
ncbi:hypothetical protein PHYBOEH_003372 [Phytophthora boehmeriae]|uniref:Necrosis inducing-like protein NPP1 type n=1 Tax=Phytophthora boehmeriae TaxID=109152 RepID=A0A8T1WUV4_9STRA|nr:hypothetical protein PHYBOEH_003372 [Phytophthora boehmeriae]